MINANKKIEIELRSNITNEICCLGGLISHMNNLIAKKYISKKDLFNALKQQSESLENIQNSKDKILNIIKNESI